MKIKVRIEKGSSASDYIAEAEVPDLDQSEPHTICKSQITIIAQDLFSSIPITERENK